MPILPILKIKDFLKQFLTSTSLHNEILSRLANIEVQINSYQNELAKNKIRDANFIKENEGILNVKSILGRAKLMNPDGWKANLESATLKGAQLKGVWLRGANLKGADLNAANLNAADLKGADLNVANLEGADLRFANLGGVKLYAANLEGANLWGAKLEGADLRHSDLKGANLVDANLVDANLQGANLIEANLQRARDLTIEQLSKVKSLYEAKLDDSLMKEIEADVANREHWDYLFSEESTEGEE